MHVELKAGELTAVVGDNEAHDGHRAGYNGVHSLTSAHCPDNLFADGLAGLNLEHLLDGRDMPDVDVYFEPRRQPMELEHLGPRAAQLHQMTTPTLKVQSLTTFTLSPPHYVDMEFRLVLREDALRYDYLACFWASYMRAPHDRAMYFLGRPREQTMGEGWQRLMTREHNDQSTVCHVGRTPELENEMISRDSLAYNYSRLGFTRPLWYGRRGTMVYALMFDLTDEVRFTHSPTGGGTTDAGPNPAWDFQLVVPDCTVDHEYVLHARVIYKPYVNEKDIIAEYESWDPLLVE